MTLAADLRNRADEVDFSGVATVRTAEGRVAEVVRGYSNRAERRSIGKATAFGVASATKGLTALTVAAMIEAGELEYDTTLRSLVGDDLPNVAPDVTIEQLLGHRSGVGDYLDEEAIGDIDDEIFDVPMQRLDRPDAYLPLVAAPPQVSPPGTRFAYNNGGYVMLAVAIERAGGRPFQDAVQALVLDPADMAATAFHRSDRLPADVALGYLRDGRTNVFHLPVCGCGDGGVYTTVDDVDRLWDALFAGRIVSPGTVARLTSPRSDAPLQRLRYGLGFWLRRDRDTVMLEGMDAGVSFRAAFDRPRGVGYTVVSNTSSGAWPLVELLDERLPSLASE